MYKFKIESLLKIIFLICLISIISAYFIEYVLGHQPCSLCLIERIPYILGLLLIILNYTFIKDDKFIILNPIKPLAIVKTLYGRGVKPARKRIPSQA